MNRQSSFSIIHFFFAKSWQNPASIRIFPKVDHSANVARIVLVDCTGSVVDGVLDDNYINTKSLPKLCQNFNNNLIETLVLGRNV